jgi:hypothetical protein
VSIRAQSAAAVSRQNSSHEGENSKNSSADKIQSILSQRIASNLTSEDDQISSQNSLSFITLLIRLHIKSFFDETEEMLIISVFIKANEIALLNKSTN